MAWNGSNDKGGANGQTSVKKKTKAGKPSPLRGVVAGALVVAFVVGMYFVFFSGFGRAGKVEVKEHDAGKKPGSIKVVEPVKLPDYRPVLTNDEMIVLPNGVVTNKPKTIAEAIAMVRLKPGFHFYKSVDEVFSKTNYFQIGEYKTLNLKSSTEAHLSLIATRRRDQLMPPMPPMPPAMANDFQKALDNYLKAEEGDSETDIRTKKKIEMMKEMMLKYVNEDGMTPGQAIQEIERDHNRSANLYQLYRGEYIRMVRQNNPDADAFYDRAIEDLRGKGAPMFDRDARYIEED